MNKKPQNNTIDDVAKLAGVSISTVSRVINGEDIAIVERMQIGRGSPAMDGGVFSPAFETTTHHFQKSLLERLVAVGIVA